MSAGEDGDLVVWDLASGREVARFPDHSFAINRLTVAPESNRVFTSAPDRSIRIWEIRAGAPQRKGR